MVEVLVQIEASILATDNGLERPFIISVEGNMGSGKSTVLEAFRDNPDVEVVPEPVSLWCNLYSESLNERFNLLEDLYRKPSR